MQSHNIWYDTTAVWQSISGGWTNDAYRQITLEKPATGELKTWLEANAVRLPLTGTWVFKNAPTAPSLDVDSREISSSTNISILFPDYTGAEPLLLTRIEASSDGTISFETYIDGEPNLVGAYSNGTWEDSSLRTITFTQPVQYQGNEEFVKWFVDNAVPVDGGINYLLNDSIRGTTSYIINASSYNFKKTQLSPLFQNVSFKYKGKEFTEIYCSGYLHRSQLSTGSGSKKKYMNSSTLHIDLHFTNGDYTVGIASNDATNRTAWQSSSSSYPSYPVGLDLSTKDIILSFDTAPTGSFLTWLNEHAILIPTTK